MSSSAITTQVAQLKAGSIQNQADSSSIYSAGVWSFKNSTAVASVTISDAGNVGIGTASPATKLDVNGGIRIPALSSLQMGNGSTYIYTDIAANGSFIVGTSSAERMRVDASGNVGIGAAPTQKVHIHNGICEVQRNAGTGNASYYALHHAGSTYVFHNISSNVNYDVVNSANGVRLSLNGTSWGAISDERKKKNIKPLEYGLAQISALKPVRFDYKTEESDGSERIGFIAQELLPVIKEAVQGSEDTEYSVTPTDLIPVLVKAIQEQQAQIEALRAEVAALKAP